ncbi:MAG: hypothetical protein AB1767_12010 [Bacillota bacterium]
MFKKINLKTVRKAAAVTMILCLVMVIAMGAAAEDETVKKGFMLLGMGALFDGTEQIRGGVDELIDGNEQLVEGLDTLGGALDKDLAGNLGVMKSGIDVLVIPGLDAILQGLTGDAVPGLREMKTGIDGQLIPGMNDLIAAFKPEGDFTKGITDMSDGLGGLLYAFNKKAATSPDGKSGIVEGLTFARYGLKMSDHPVPGAYDPTDPDTWGLSEGLATVLATIGGPPLPAVNPLTDPAPALTTSIIYDVLYLQALSNVGMLDAATCNNIVNNAIIPKLQGVHGGYVADPADVGGLTKVKGAIDTRLVPGFDLILGGLTNADPTKGVVAALTAMKTGIDTKLLPGINNLILPGMKDVRDKGLKVMSAGVGDLITALTKTEGVGGYAAVLDKINQFPVRPSTGSNVGLIEGLTQIRLGLSSLDPVNEPGVSEGLGLAETAVRTDVLGGIAQLKGGITEKILPGLTAMNAGISDQLQPGFSKVSMLLGLIWLVTLVIVLVVGLLVGRAKKKASGHSASV